MMLPWVRRCCAGCPRACRHSHDFPCTPGPTPEELKQWFGDRTVVHLHSAYNVNVNIEGARAKKIAKRLKEGIKQSSPRQ